MCHAGGQRPCTVEHQGNYPRLEIGILFFRGWRNELVTAVIANTILNTQIRSQNDIIHSHRNCTLLFFCSRIGNVSKVPSMTMVTISFVHCLSMTNNAMSIFVMTKTITIHCPMITMVHHGMARCPLFARLSFNSMTARTSHRLRRTMVKCGM